MKTYYVQKDNKGSLFITSTKNCKTIGKLVGEVKAEELTTEPSTSECKLWEPGGILTTTTDVKIRVKELKFYDEYDCNCTNCNMPINYDESEQDDDSNYFCKDCWPHISQLIIIPKDVKYVFKNPLSFGEALSELKENYKVARKGWNGKGMYLKLIQGYPVNGHIHAATAQDDPTHSRRMFEVPEFNYDGSPNITQGKPGQMLPHIVLKTAGDSKYWGEGFSDYVPWTPSQTDILADDWEIVEPASSQQSSPSPKIVAVQITQDETTEKLPEKYIDIYHCTKCGTSQHSSFCQKCGNITFKNITHIALDAYSHADIHIYSFEFLETIIRGNWGVNIFKNKYDYLHDIIPSLYPLCKEIADQDFKEAFNIIFKQNDNTLLCYHKQKNILLAELVMDEFGKLIEVSAIYNNPENQ
jgi:hypothetical protein